MNVCIVGGGSLGHVIAGWMAHKGLDVSILTRRPSEWENELLIHTSNGDFKAPLKRISSKPRDVIPDSKVVLLTVPGYANKNELELIKPFISNDTYVGGVFCSSGFFFEALKILPNNIKLWGFQRVPFISRTVRYGKEANLLGFKQCLNIALERASDEEKESFRNWIQSIFETETILQSNYLEVSITNSNPILHTSRLYTLFSEWDDEKRIDNNILFYEDWDEESADLLIKMDEELFRIIDHLPVNKNFIPPILDYYECHDALSLKNKLSSIESFKGIKSPMIQDDKGWHPDYNSRYFTEDFGYSLRFIWELAKKYSVDTPYIDMVYEWGQNKIKA